MQMLDSILTVIVIFIPSTRSSNGFIMTQNAGTSSKSDQASRSLKRYQFSRCRSPVDDEKFPRACI